MRDYSKVSPKFWMGKTGRALRKQGMEAQLVALYMLTSPHSTMLGLYPLPLVYVAHETGLGLEGASKGLAGCIEAGFCKYDEDSETVWVIEMAHYQIAESLDVNDKQCKGVQRAYNELIENPFLSMFYDKYEADFHLTQRRVPEGACDAPSKPLTKPLASQEQEQEQEQETEQEQKPIVERRSASIDGDAIEKIFSYWQKTMNSPRSVLDDDRKKAIRKALKNYTPRQLCEAIKGCERSDFHMARGKYTGNNKQNGISQILKSAERIDRFIALVSQEVVGEETLDQRNARIIAEFVGEPQDLDVIDVEAEEVADEGN